MNQVSKNKSGEKPFNGIASDAVLKVPEALVKQYSEMEEFKESFASIEAIKQD